MCVGKPPPPPPLPAPPLRSNEEVARGEMLTVEAAKRRKNRSAVFLTGGLTDPGFGAAVTAPTVTGG